jgi:hypothetical protein
MPTRAHPYAYTRHPLLNPRRHRLGFAGVDHDPGNRDKIRQWSIEYHEALHPYSAGGGDNVFHVNRNIPPTA